MRAKLRPSPSRRALAIGQVRRHPEYGLIYITGGIYQVNGRISNAWDFRKVLKDGRLSARVYGDYGNLQWPTPPNLMVEIRVVERNPRRKGKAA